MEAWRKFRAKAPKVVDASTYFLSPAASSSGRRFCEKRAAKEVGEWLVSYFPADMVEVRGGEVYLDGVLVFSLYHSARHVYRRQNLRVIREKFVEQYGP